MTPPDDYAHRICIACWAGRCAECVARWCDRWCECFFGCADWLLEGEP